MTLGHDVGRAKAGLLERILEKLGLHRPELRAWAMYDWANSAMVTTIITAIFPIYYSSVACEGVFTPEEATRRYSTATVIGMVIIALLSPVLGTIADLKGDKKKMLGGFLALGVFSVAGMFFIYQGDWLLASVSVHPGEHRRQRQFCLLRRASAARRSRGRDRPCLDGRLCARLLSAAARCWRSI